MAYYNWATAQLPLETGEQPIFVNLLYGKRMDSSQYQSFRHLKEELCLNRDIFCQAVLEEL